jgi:subtilisin
MAETTGRYLVLLPEGVTTLSGAAEVFPTLGVAVLDEEPRGLVLDTDYLAIEPERVVYAIQDESQVTWGLQATNVPASSYTGAGVKVAVLDTGMDLEHPDFEGRAITSRSFFPGQTVQDGNGHGTHCIGTACGPADVVPRYGIASGAEIFAGKVLSNAGSGGDAQILGGIDWAVANGCAVVSMSLGAAVAVGADYSTVFETAAQRAAAAGTLIVAAAGNNGPDEPVNHPANCPSIMAVAAVDSNLVVADFSARGLDPDGGAIDFAGPGVDVYSSVPMPERYDRFNGTSMATPHAAGIAALHAEADPETRGLALGERLKQTAKPLPGVPASDAGAGLVLAP